MVTCLPLQAPTQQSLLIFLQSYNQGLLLHTFNTPVHPYGPNVTCAFDRLTHEYSGQSEAYSEASGDMPV